jgi:hypothetical protein
MRIPILIFFWEIDKVVSSIFTQSEQTFFPCFPCVADSENKILTSPQRELLLWHWKLGINMYWVQELMRERTFEEPLGKRMVLPPIIKPKFISAWNCVIPVCQSCLLAHARKRTPNVKHSTVILENEGALSRNRYEVGDFVSTIISLFAKLLVPCLRVMAVSQKNIVFRGEQFIMMLNWAAFGLKIKFLLVPMRG